MQSKPWYTSRTLWVNTLTVIGAMIGLVASNATELSLDPQGVLILTGIALPLVNMLLRAITSQALA